MRTQPTFQAFGGVPSFHGHFVLESGLHAETWLDLDSLFLEPFNLGPQIAALASLIIPYGVTAICGPLLGGALVAQAVATQLRLKFYVAQRLESKTEGGLFEAKYGLPPSQRQPAKYERFAVVDDVISAGSSVRATVNELQCLGAEIAVVGALLNLGERASEHFIHFGIPVVSPAKQSFVMWEPNCCPHCLAGIPLQPPPS